VQGGLGALPSWLLWGLVIGVAGSVIAAAVFLVAGRLFPGEQPARRTREAGGEVKRRGEIREYLRTIEEPFAENHPVEGQSVAFYLPERDVAITFDARAYYRIDRSRTVPVLVEHEMPGLQLGARLPFETPEIEFGPDPAEAVDPVGEAFAELGVAPTASQSEVRSAYRERVKQVHPDHGGDEDEFKRVREAYTRAKQHAS